MKKEKKHHGVKVSHLSYYNAVTLIASFVLFVIAIFYPGIYLYLIYIMVEAVILFISFYITASTYFRLLFIADPQKISMLDQKNNNAIISIFPFILDKRKIQVHVSSIKFKHSTNYEIVGVTLDGSKLKISKCNEKSCEAVVGTDIDISSRFEIIIKLKAINLNSRFFSYYIYYQRKEKSRLFKFEESHTVD
jgi:hypothetical protein